MAIENLRRAMFIALAALALPGVGSCQQAVPVAQKADAPAPRAKQATAVNFERETKTFAFTYEYPAEAAALPKLASTLNAERGKTLAELEKQAAEAQKDAADNDYPFNPHMLGVSWRVTGENAQLLAMVAEISSFSGGAHGNSGYEALVWDKAENRRIELNAVFLDPAAALEPLREPYCNALNADRRERRGDYVGEPDDMFNICPAFSDLVLVPYAGGGGGFDRLMLLAAPYVAGSYAEGAYEISLPLPGATLDQVKPDYRSAFSATAN